MIQLSSLTNLGVLIIGEKLVVDGGDLDNTLVRAWSRAATEADAFKHLRAIGLQSQYAITDRVFDYLSQLPQLELFHIKDPIGRIDGFQDQPEGWQRYEGSKLRWLDFDFAEWSTIYDAWLEEDSTLDVGGLMATNPRAFEKLPVLDFHLGYLSGKMYARTLSFYRTPQQMFVLDKPSTRKRSADASKVCTLSRKKPTLRATKRRDMDGFFSELGM